MIVNNLVNKSSAQVPIGWAKGTYGTLGKATKNIVYNSLYLYVSSCSLEKIVLLSAVSSIRCVFHSEPFTGRGVSANIGYLSSASGTPEFVSLSPCVYADGELTIAQPLDGVPAGTMLLLFDGIDFYKINLKESSIPASGSSVSSTVYVYSPDRLSDINVSGFVGDGVTLKYGSMFAYSSNSFTQAIVSYFLEVS